MPAEAENSACFLHCSHLRRASVSMLTITKSPVMLPILVPSPPSPNSCHYRLLRGAGRPGGLLWQKSVGGDGTNCPGPRETEHRNRGEVRSQAGKEDGATKTTAGCRMFRQSRQESQRCRSKHGKLGIQERLVAHIKVADNREPGWPLSGHFCTVDLGD